MKTKTLGLLAMGLLAVSTTTTASAATIVGTCGPATATDVGIVNAFADCVAFDPSLGTLTGITYSVSARYFGSFEIVNYGDAEGTRTAGVAEMLVMIIQGELDELYLDEVESIAIPETTLKPGDRLSVPYDSTLSTSGAIDPSLFFAFIAPFPVFLQLEVGVMDLPPYIGECFFPSPAGVCILEDDPIVNATIAGALTYTYDAFVDPVPTPEPGSLALLGLGLAGLGLSRRRKAN